MKISFVILIWVTFILGCNHNTQELTSEPLAKVGDKILFMDEVRESVPVYQMDADSATSVKNYVDNWIRKQVLVDEAIRLGLDTQPTIKSRIDRAVTDILIAELRNQIQLNNIQESVSDEDVAQFYTTNREMFVLNERHVKVRHLFNTDPSALERARTDLASGLSWDEIVRNYAIDVEYSLQTDKQLVAVSQAFSGYTTLQSYLRVIGLNEISPITLDTGYYHFIQIVEDRPTGDHPELPYVFDRIKEWLILDKSRRAFKTYEQNLVVQAEANGEIVIYSEDIN